MVFYLKYRPQTLDELDNSHVAVLIGKYLSNDSIPHAFLLTGPRGTGKTSTARIIAKSVNCQNEKTTGQACGKCDICLSIGRGDNLDILEIDAASNRGIDEIRDLREKIKLSPSNLKYKVYIIDEVHMLTTEAFNALLKTLEEPPKHAIFILATTEINKVPETIISRCVKVDFQKGTQTDIEHSLQRVIKGEKLQVDKDALQKIIEIADGSFRDAAKILEELTLDKTKIDLKLVIVKMGSTDKSKEIEFIKSLHNKNAKNLLLIIKDLSDQGKNIRQFFVNILKTLEYMALSYYQSEKGEWNIDEIKLALNLLAQAFIEVKTTILPQLPFELAVIEYCEKSGIGVVLPNTTTSSSTTSVSPVVERGEVGMVLDKWEEILVKLKPYNHSVAGVLRSCKPISLVGKDLTIEAAYKFHAERISDGKVRELIAKIIQEVVGIDVAIKTSIKKR